MTKQKTTQHGDTTSGGEQKERHAASLGPVRAHVCQIIHSYNTLLHAHTHTPVTCGAVCNLRPDVLCFKGFTTTVSVWDARLTAS